MTSRPTPLTTGEFLKRRAQSDERQKLRAPDRAAFRQLNDREFSRLLNRACVDHLFPTEFTAEMTWRAEAGLLRARDLRALLLDSAAHTGTLPARSAAWTTLTRFPERATAILTSQAQAAEEAILVLRMLPAGKLGSFGVQAGWRTPSGFVHGIAAYAGKRKEAQHQAVVSLLGHLSAVQLVIQESGDSAEWKPVGAPASPAPSASPGPALPAVPAEDGFHAQLQQACAQTVVAPALVAEITARAWAGVLDPRALHLVLFDAQAPQWEPARQAIIGSAATESSGWAPTILTHHATAVGQPTPTYEDSVITGDTQEATRYRASVTYDPGTGLLRADSEPQRSKKHARRSAALALLAQLTGLPLPERSVTSERKSMGPLPPGKNPLSALNEFAQIEFIKHLDFDVSPGGRGKQLLFNCRVSCRLGNRDLDATGRGLSKTEAREDAARALLALIATADEPLSQAPVQAVPAIKPLPTSKDPLGAVNSLQQTGVITDVKPDYAATGPTHRRAFKCTLSCRYQDVTIQAEGHASTKRDSYRDAARALLARLALMPAGPAQQTTDIVPASADPAAVPHQRNLPSATPRGTPTETLPAIRLLHSVLQAGAALTADLNGNTPRMLIFAPEGGLLPDPPTPLRPETAELVLPGTGAAVSAVPMPVWSVPLRLLAGVLAHLDGENLHATAHTWRAITRLGLQAIAEERVYPSTDSTGHDTWRLGPLTPQQRATAAGLAETMLPYAHCALATRNPYRLWAPRMVLRQTLDALADTVVRGPGTAHVLGLGPYTAPTPRQQSSALVTWTDRIDALVDQDPPPCLVLTIKPPAANSPDDIDLLWAILRIRTTTPGGEPRLLDVAELLPEQAADPVQLERIRRILRAAAQAWPPLQRLLGQDQPTRFTLRPAEATLLLGEMGHDVARAGVEITWPGQWAHALSVRTVVGTRSTGDNDKHSFSLDNVLDFRWQLALDGDNLTDTEMDAVASAASGSLVHMRQRWLLVTTETAHRAAHRDLGTLPAAEALIAALAGSITVKDERLPCEPAGALADLVEFLRVGSHQPVPIPKALRATLRGYQMQGLAWLAHTTRLGFGACLADDMGTGKSITAIALHLHRREQTERTVPTLIICTASMLSAWEREIARFAPATPTHRYYGENRHLDGLAADTIVITTYGTLRSDVDILAAQTFDLIIADEAQQAKNHRSLTAQQLRRLNAKARVALTGTPIENGPMEAWAIADWANPGLLGTPRTFSTRYARPIEQDPSGEHARRLARVLSPFMLRRRKSDPHILKELPEKIISRRHVALTREQIALYEAVARDTMAQIRAAKTGERQALVLTLLTQLRQICNTPAHFLRETPQLHDYDADAQQRRSGKLTAVDELLSKITAAGESALMFTNYTAMAKLLITHLRARGIEPLFLHGQVPARARQRLVDAFQDRLNSIMVLTVKAGGTGLTLTEASHVILFDRPWNPAIEDQAVDRAHRIGQTSPLEVHLMQTELTIEDRIDALLKHKRALAEAILHNGETVLTELSDAELADLIALGARQ